MPPDDDIEFDFFDEEPVTAEAPQQSRLRLPQRAPRQPREPRDPGDGAHPLTPVIRLGVLVVIGIFIVLVFALLIKGCASESEHDAYSGYMDNVGTIATQSATDGRRTVTVLTSPGLDAAEIVKRLDDIAAAEQQNVV